MSEVVVKLLCPRCHHSEPRTMSASLAKKFPRIWQSIHSRTCPKREKVKKTPGKVF